MTETLHPPAVASRERHYLTADAFLLAALIFLVAIAVQQTIALLLGAGESGTWTPPVWLQAIGALGMPLAVIGGPLLAWWLYGRHLGWRDLVAGVMGIVLAGAAFSIAMVVVVFLTRVISTSVDEDEGPWGLVVIATLAVVAFLAGPVAAAVRDLVGPKEHLGRHLLRLAIVALGLVAIVVSVFIGGEVAGLGLFMLLPAIPAAGAAFAMHWRSAHKHQPEAPSI
ncbi:MAG: hypothetical protein WCA30_15250 [Dermatophilaceae bacterium]